MSKEVKLTADPERVGKYSDKTGIYVTATLNGKTDGYDIAELDYPSLLAFIRSRGGKSPEGLIALLLDYDVF